MNERNLHNSYTDLAPLLAKRFRERREQLGISQEAVANAAYISLFSYSKFERGKSNPNTPMNPELATLLAIARALKMDICKLLDFDDESKDGGSAGGGASGGSTSVGSTSASENSSGNASASETGGNSAGGSESDNASLDDDDRGSGDRGNAKSHIYKKESLATREENTGREEIQFEAELTSEEFARALGKKLQQLRWERDMTTQETARLAGISMHRYHYLEKGESRPGTPANPKLSTLVGLANAFDIPLHKLLELHTIDYAVVPF